MFDIATSSLDKFQAVVMYLLPTNVYIHENISFFYKIFIIHLCSYLGYLLLLEIFIHHDNGTANNKQEE